MALSAIDSIRNAELDSQRRIEAAKDESLKAQLSAKETAVRIIAEAEESAKALISSSADKAHAKAQEILAQSRENAATQADSIRKIDKTVQDNINNKLLEIII